MQTTLSPLAPAGSLERSDRSVAPCRSTANSQPTGGKAWTLHDPKVREFLWFCLPALALALILRALMTWQMPYGYMQFDTVDFLLTTHRLLTKGQFLIHSKRTFLVPVLYTIPFLLKVPALIVIPIAQHLLGLGVVFITGALTRLWLRPWKWAIVPLTLLMAANPNLLWFEHTLMSESVYLFCVFSLVLAATLYSKRPTTRHFAFLLLGLFFTASARPEGRLLLGFGFLLLPLVHWGNWSALWPRMAWLAGLAAVTLPLTRTGQAGQLLYATVLPLAPDVSKVDPGFSEQVRPLRDEIRAAGGLNPHLQGLEQKLTDMTGTYLEAKGEQYPDTNAFCQKLAIEACLNNPLAVPHLALRKLLLSTRSAVSIGYDEPRLQQKLEIGFSRKNMFHALSRGLVGIPLPDEAAVSAFVAAHYHSFSWYPFFDLGWRRLTVGYESEIDRPDKYPDPPLPIFFALGLAGMAIMAATRGSFQKLHVAWILCLCGLWFAVLVTGVVNPRYRYLFEPFCLIYAVLGVTSLGVKMVGAFRAGASREPVNPIA